MPRARARARGPVAPVPSPTSILRYWTFFVSLRTLIASYIKKYFGIFGTYWEKMVVDDDECNYVIMYFLLHIHLRLRPLQSRQSRNRCHLCRSRCPRPWMGRTCEVSETDYIASTPKDLVRAPSESMFDSLSLLPSFLPSLPAPPHPLGVLWPGRYPRRIRYHLQCITWNMCI